MKKIVILLIVLCLCGCSKSDEDSLSKLGYSEEEIQIIDKLPEGKKGVFFDEYNEIYSDLINHEGFNIDNLDKYVKYYDSFGIDRLIDIVNNDYSHIDKLAQLYNSEYYLNKYENLYLKYLDSYDSVRDCIEAINTKTYLDYYTDIIPTDTSKNYLMLVNKYNALSSDYVPDDLVPVEAKYGRGYTRFEVYEQYKKLQDDANELGYYFTICSAYRGYDVQEGLYNGYLANEGGIVEAVDAYSARPGHSEHQSGLCLDLFDIKYGMDDFGLSEASKWVDENCYKYGFIIRYTKEKQKITGYQAEPWQIRYVGSSEIAKDIMDRGITFDEYYACFVQD